MADPIQQTLTNLLTGWGYNLYDKKNRARADDQLVRARSADLLAEGANAVRALRTAYQKRFIPPATRDNPFPPPERLAQLRALADLQERLADLETRIRSMVVPTQDRVWEHFRSERALLNQLLQHDYNLIAPCQELHDAVQALTAAEWGDDAAASVDLTAGRVESAIRARTAFLQAPGF